MPTTTCQLHTIILVIVIILIIAFADEIFTTVPVLVKLFTDPVNFILLIIGVILVLLIDLPCGILLSFVVLYLAIYVKRMIKNNKDRFENIAITTSILNTQQKNTLSKLPLNYLSESEINYNNTKPFANNNIPPFQPVVQESIDTNTKQIMPNIACNQNDSITPVGAPSRDGYDVAGCRYDFKDSMQNMTMFGPPLSACGAYNAKQTNTCGTLFYPLNA